MRKRVVLLAGLLSLCAIAGLARHGLSAQTARPLDVEYREAAGRLIGAAMVDRGGYDKLAYLTTRIGNRLSGSPGLERAVAWVAEQMKADGLENVRTQPVKVPHWVRGSESARVVKPFRGLSTCSASAGASRRHRTGSPRRWSWSATSTSSTELGADKVKGRIVLYDMPWQGYGQTVTYRSCGRLTRRPARRRRGARALGDATKPLLAAHRRPELTTAGLPKIPAAAITVEDAAWIRQMTAMGQDVQVQLQMEAETLPDADSANVMGEIVGRERPDEVVVIGGHLDSWDVGQGAHDDGGGVVAAWRPSRS